MYGQKEDYYSAEGILEFILKNTARKRIDFKRITLPFLHPVNSAEILYDGKSIGFLGEIHPDITGKLDLRHPAYAAEFDTSLLSDFLNQSYEIMPIIKFPPTTRDISIVVPHEILARDLMHEIEKFHEWIKEVAFVDIFRGVQIGQNKKSLTFTILFQNAERTLNDAEVNTIMDSMVEKLKAKYQAELRG